MTVGGATCIALRIEHGGEGDVISGDPSHVVEPDRFEFGVGASATAAVRAGTVIVGGDTPVESARAGSSSTSATSTGPAIEVFPIMSTATER